MRAGARLQGRASEQGVRLRLRGRARAGAAGGGALGALGEAGLEPVRRSASGEGSRRTQRREGRVPPPPLTLSLWAPVVQVFCVIPKYLQPFLRKTLGTREWPPPSPAAGILLGTLPSPGRRCSRSPVRMQEGGKVPERDAGKPEAQPGLEQGEDQGFLLPLPPSPVLPAQGRALRWAGTERGPGVRPLVVTAWTAEASSSPPRGQGFLAGLRAMPGPAPTNSPGFRLPCTCWPQL